ncbi:MAG: restriction endonuclease subunit S, partial [Bacteroidaceae bacterium]|nr:restriction endonuclease subunit S [Bacteroidaceae bacterium]
KLLEEAAQRLYKEWFIDLLFPGHEKSNIIDGVPEGWEKKKIGDVCQTVGGGTPSTKVAEYYDNGNIKWVTPTDITRSNCLCLFDTDKRITEEGLAHSSAKMLPSETILMTSRASVGYFGIYDCEVCTNQGFISCIPNEKSYQMYLLYNLMNRVEEIRQKAGGSTYLEISKSVFRNFDVVLPSSVILEAFQEQTHKMLDSMRLLAKQLRLLTEARDRLLPKLMSGEIEV